VRILVVEDDASIASSVTEAIEHLGWSAVHAQTGTAALQHLHSGTFDCVVLDLGLPDLDGGEVVRRTREISNIPIVVASARPDESDRILALELGADDYLVKPFGIRELIARVRAVHRRHAGGTADSSESTRHSVGGLTVDSRTREVTLDDQAIDLTPKEFDVLAYLISEPGTVFKRETLLSDVWDINWYGSTKTLDAHIASIRRKLGRPERIESVRGVGFRLVDPS
jgi:DNA-binding response OmpR family regulator